MAGIDNLKKVYHSTPDFCDEKALEDVTRQLYEVTCITSACFLSRPAKLIRGTICIILACFLSRPITLYKLVCLYCNVKYYCNSPMPR